MSTLREIGNKLFKEDLASQKVELTIKDDTLKLISDYENSSKNLDSKINGFYDNVFSAKSSFESIKDSYNTFVKNENELLLSKQKAIALGKELGIDVTSAPFYKDLLAAIKRAEDIQSEYSSANLVYKSIKI